MRTFADFAFHPDAAPLGFDQMLGNSQAETCTPCFAGTGRIHTVEAFENTRLIRLRYADASIGNGEHHFEFVHFNAENNFAAGERVLTGVVEEVLQYFGEAATVTGYGGSIRRTCPRKGRCR